MMASIRDHLESYFTSFCLVSVGRRSRKWISRAVTPLLDRVQGSHELGKLWYFGDSLIERVSWDQLEMQFGIFQYKFMEFLPLFEGVTPSRDSCDSNLLLRFDIGKPVWNNKSGLILSEESRIPADFRLKWIGKN